MGQKDLDIFYSEQKTTVLKFIVKKKMPIPKIRYNIKPVIFTDRDLDQETTDLFIKSARQNNKQDRKAAAVETVQENNKQYSTVAAVEPVQENNKLYSTVAAIETVQENNKQYSTIQRNRVEDGIEEKKESRKGKSGNNYNK